MKMIIPLKTTMLTVMLGASTFNVSAAWQVSGTFCQSYTDDGQILVRVKPSVIGLIEQQPQCNGRGSTELSGSNFGVNNSTYPSSVMCNAQSNYHAAQSTNATKDIQAVISMLRENQSVSINTFGTRTELNTTDFAQACSSIINQKVAEFDPQKTYQQDMAKMGYKQDANGQWHKQSKQAYSREADPEIAANYNPKAGVAEGSGKGGFYGDEANKNLYGPGSQAEKDAAAANEARRLAAQNRVSAPESATSADMPLNAFCNLNNGKNVGVYAAAGHDYHYTYTDKSDKPELELKEGMFGVKAFHYHTSLGMGTASYVRFNKGAYDYILLNKDTGHEEFQGIRVYKNGDLISSHECKTKLTLDTSTLPQNNHFDNEKMGDYFTAN